jgi:hypothetical protein
MRSVLLRCLASVALALALTGCTDSTEPAAAQSGRSLERFLPNLTFTGITDVQSGPGDALFVVEQPGRIQRVDPSAENPQKSVFLDLTGRVSSAGNETGLLGLAFHPNYAQNGRFFVNYTAKRDDQLYTRIAEFVADAADVPGSETLVLEVAQPFSNHNAGQLQFGPGDGPGDRRLLYVALGDGGSGGDPRENGQDRSTLLGSMLRLDVDARGGTTPDCGGAETNYFIPSDNPFTEDPSACGEIFAYGFRNPFRFSFGPEGLLFAGDVGQNRREEIDVVRKGENYGWNETEGSICYDDANCDPSQYTLPVAEYDHSDTDASPGGRSVTGGYVYTLDCQSCSDATGRYFYGDFITGNIWSFAYDAQGAVTNNRLEIDDSGLSISTFGRTAAGELLVADRNGSSSALYRFDRSTLPVELTSFEAQPDGADVTFTWRTAAETSNARFVVEATRRRGASSGGWTTLGRLTSRAEGGTTTAPQHYRLRADAPGYGHHRFRLRQIDRDGTGRVVARAAATVRPEKALALSRAHPNPAHGRATVELALREAQRVTVTLYDAAGRQVRRLHEGTLGAGATQRFTVGGGDGLASGVYLVRAVGETFAATRAVTLVR